MQKKAVDWLEDLTFTEIMWFNIRDLAKERGFEYPRAALTADENPDCKYMFTSGMTVAQVLCLKAEMEAGGWSHTHTSRRRHFFSKPYERFDNPSLCKRHKLDFITRLDHDFDNDDKCLICFKKYKRLCIVQVVAADELVRLMEVHLPNGLEVAREEVPLRDVQNGSDRPL